MCCALLTLHNFYRTHFELLQIVCGVKVILKEKTWAEILADANTAKRLGCDTNYTVEKHARQIRVVIAHSLECLCSVARGCDVRAGRHVRNHARSDGGGRSEVSRQIVGCCQPTPALPKFQVSNLFYVFIYLSLLLRTHLKWEVITKSAMLCRCCCSTVRNWKYIFFAFPKSCFWLWASG